MTDVLERACERYHDALRAQHDRVHDDHHPYPGPTWAGLSEHERERIRELLRPVVAALVPGQVRGFVTIPAEEYEKALRGVREAEREACARAAEEMWSDKSDPIRINNHWVARQVAAFIRRRGKETT